MSGQILEKKLDGTCAAATIPEIHWQESWSKRLSFGRRER
jgi:hypothetical protein